VKYAFNSSFDTLACENRWNSSLQLSLFGVFTHQQDFLRTLLCLRVL
jgi:hypothetical protein